MPSYLRGNPFSTRNSRKFGSTNVPKRKSDLNWGFSVNSCQWTPKGSQNSEGLAHKSAKWSYKYVFLLFFFFITVFWPFLIAPSIKDDSTIDQKLNKVLFSSEEAPKAFENCEINDLLRPLPDFEPISITTHSGKPQNIDIQKHWHPLRLFKLFFSWETMSIIVDSTNSYAFRTNSA